MKYVGVKYVGDDSDDTNKFIVTVLQIVNCSQS